MSDVPVLVRATPGSTREEQLDLIPQPEEASSDGPGNFSSAATALGAAQHLGEDL